MSAGSTATSAVGTTPVKTEETKAPEAPGYLSIDGFNTRVVKLVQDNLYFGKCLELSKDQNIAMKVVRVVTAFFLALLASPIAIVKWAANKICCCSSKNENVDETKGKKEEKPVDPDAKKV